MISSSAAPTTPTKGMQGSDMGLKSPTGAPTHPLTHPDLPSIGTRLSEAATQHPRASSVSGTAAGLNTSATLGQALDDHMGQLMGTPPVGANGGCLVGGTTPEYDSTTPSCLMSPLGTSGHLHRKDQAAAGGGAAAANSKAASSVSV